MPVNRLLLLCIIATAGPSFAGAQDAKPSLAGEWTTDCLPIGKNGRHGYVTRIKIDGGVMTATSQLYAKSSCQTPTVQVNYSGKLSIDDAADAYIDFSHTVEKITFTPNIDDVSAQYNKDTQRVGCGLTGWKTNVAMSVAGRTCAPFSFAAEGVTLYDRAWISGNQLRFGNFPAIWTATSDAQRPNAPADTVYHRTGN